jgi:hypothetical protein
MNQSRAASATIDSHMRGKPNPEKPTSMPDPESEWLDVTVPSVSGHYIELEEQGKLEELLRLKTTWERLKRDLMVTDDELGQFKNPRWLLDFYIRTRRRARRYGPTLKSEAARLERTKAKLTAELKALERQIVQMDPAILDIPSSQITGRPDPPLAIGLDDNPHVLVRDLTIKKLAKSGISEDAEICKRLDSELMQRDAPPLGIPEAWVEEFGDEWKKKHGWNFYFAAYRHPRTKNRMQKMISKAKVRSS